MTGAAVSRQIKVLQVVPSLSRGAGVSRFAYNMTIFSDESRVHYDILHHAQNDGVPHHEKRFDEELEDLGHVIYKVDFAGHDLKRFMREVRAVFAEHGGEYDVVHCHMPNSAFCVLKEAEAAGIEHRVLHSHLNSSSDKFLHRVRNAPLIAMGKRYVTDRAACSKEAGDYLFGSEPFTVMNNGIPLRQFAYSAESDRELRAELGIPEGAPVVGCVGRFVKQKNFEFATRAFAELRKSVPEARMVILGYALGDGVDRVRAIAEQEGVAEGLLLPGVRSDVERFYSMFDVFFMPSLYEGLPVSAVEAQASGLPCVFSTGVPAESDIAGEGRFLSLDEPLSEWAGALRQAIEGGRIGEPEARLAAAGYSAEANAERLMEFYEGLCR